MGIRHSSETLPTGGRLVVFDAFPSQCLALWRANYARDPRRARPTQATPASYCRVRRYDTRGQIRSIDAPRILSRNFDSHTGRGRGGKLKLRHHSQGYPGAAAFRSYGPHAKPAKSAGCTWSKAVFREVCPKYTSRVGSSAFPQRVLPAATLTAPGWSRPLEGANGYQSGEAAETGVLASVVMVVVARSRMPAWRSMRCSICSASEVGS